MVIAVVIAAVSITAAYLLPESSAPAEVTPMSTAEPTPIVTAEPTATPEPTLPPEIAKLPIFMQTMTDELPEDCEFLQEESKFVIHSQFGDVTYEGVTAAGTNEYGYAAFYFEDCKQECWILGGLTIGVIDHLNEGGIYAKNITHFPTFSNDEVELAWHGANGDLSAIMIVLDELNISWNNVCKKEFSDELKEYMLECNKEYDPEVVGALEEEILYLAKIFNGPTSYQGLYPSYKEGGAYLYDTRLGEGPMREIMLHFVKSVKEIYPEYRQYSSILVNGAADYILINTNEVDKYKYWNQFKKVSDLMTKYILNPTVETYYEIQKDTWSSEIYVAPTIMFAMFQREYDFYEGSVPDRSCNQPLEYRGVTTTHEKLRGEIQIQLNNLLPNYNYGIKPGFTTSVAEYTDELDINIPEEAPVEEN